MTKLVALDCPEDEGTHPLQKDEIGWFGASPSQKTQSANEESTKYCHELETIRSKTLELDEWMNGWIDR